MPIIPTPRLPSPWYRSYDAAFFSNQRTAAGISLVEMMIAMVIGLVLMLGVIQVFFCVAYRVDVGRR
ncbi:hypothetical protein GDR29_14615 [Xanthomonas oryzae pv. oryzae]|nr:hypothetical protein GDR29_14615 [Xanthomonas oryzae pv. oryzae]